MELWADPESYRDACERARRRGERVAIVPTMGALHEGHLALVRKAREIADYVTVSVFVNPTQFGKNEDFSKYPRALSRDQELAASAGASGLFAPSAERMYPPGDQTRVRVGQLAEPLCGVFRPGHFEGVATVVTKLLALAGPSVAIFGQKDYQQLKVIERLSKDLFLPVDIVSVNTVREPDGLAMSSRNAYLSPAERALAAEIPRSLAAACKAFERGERDPNVLAGEVERRLANVATSIDYIDVRNADNLEPIQGQIENEALLAVALRIGQTRLIDNVVLGRDSGP